MQRPTSYNSKCTAATIKRPMLTTCSKFAGDAYLRRDNSYDPRPIPADSLTQQSSARAASRRRQHGAPKRKLALLLPGHNEELIIAATIKSAVKAGQKRRDIFVVDDNSSDDTRKIAVSLLGESHVLTVERSGKAGAIKKALDHFKIAERYEWVHVSDADSVFCEDYFNIYCAKLDPAKYAVAIGFVQSMRGNWICTYRALTYTYGQHVNRRVQSWLHMISVLPGPLTSFRTDILKDLEFDVDTIAEDFDITLQIHRKKLGNIAFIPKAVNYTQDPQTMRDFMKQTRRWQRGFFMGVRKYRIGLRPHLIDISLGFQILQTILFLFQVTFIVPLIIFYTHNWLSIPVAIAADFTLNSIIAIGSSMVAKRWNLLGAMPYFYFLRWVEISIYVAAFIEVMIFNKFKSKDVGWGTEGRRYKLNTLALQDVAQ